MNDKLYRCDNCGFQTDNGDSIQPWWEASEVLERLDAGGIVPYGVCPECDCFVYRYDATLLLYDGAKTLLEACKNAENALRSLSIDWSTLTDDQHGPFPGKKALVTVSAATEKVEGRTG